MIVAFSPSSSSHWWINPSIAQAEPLIMPDKRAFSVLSPIAFSEMPAPMCGSFEVLVHKDLNCKFKPGIITPPRNLPSFETTSKVVAVPISTTIAGSGKFFFAAKALATLSAPTSLGFFNAISMPVIEGFCS